MKGSRFLNLSLERPGMPTPRLRGRKELGSGTVSSHSGLELPSAPSAQLPGPHKGVNVAALRVTQLLSALAAPASALPP